jgi:hypothetical protein
MYLARKQIARRSENPNWTYWDVTVKSARPEHRCMAPTWEMVMGVKQGKLSTTEYSRRYQAILEQNKEKIWKLLSDEALSGTAVLVFQCYCRDNAFCHTYLLMEWIIGNWHRFHQQVPFIEPPSLFQANGNI